MFSVVSSGAKQYDTREEAIEAATKLAVKSAKAYGAQTAAKYDVVAILGTVGAPVQPEPPVEFTPMQPRA